MISGKRGGTALFVPRKFSFDSRKFRLVSANLPGAELLLNKTAILLVTPAVFRFSNNRPIMPSRRVTSAARSLAACGHDSPVNGASVGTGKTSLSADAERG